MNPLLENYRPVTYSTVWGIKIMYEILYFESLIWLLRIEFWNKNDYTHDLILSKSILVSFFLHCVKCTEVSYNSTQLISTTRHEKGDDLGHTI